MLRWCQKVAGVLVGFVGWLVGWLASCFVFFDTLLTVGTNLWLQHDIAVLAVGTNRWAQHDSTLLAVRTNP